MAPELRPDDEVCIILDGQLVFGTLERSKRTEASRPFSNEWTVLWSGRPDFKHKTIVSGAQLTLTDRALYKGCRVRKADNPRGQLGRCRTVNLSVALRVVGTTTIVECPDISRFTPLKEFKQKSVVYQNGWLGVITDVVRKVKIRLPTGGFSTVPLNTVQPVSPFMVEPPWINELVPNPARTINRVQFQGNVIEHENDQLNPIPMIDTIPQALFVEDLEVESVTVAWRYQVDNMTPDQPSKVLKASRLNKLKVVKEECDNEITLQMGNLGRYFLRSSDELRSLEEFERNFVKDNMPSKLQELQRNRPRPMRAYEKDPEKRIVPESSVVVEIVHLRGTGDIMWQDKTFDFVKSTDLVVLEDSLLSNEVMAGTFVFSKRFTGRTPEQVYGVVQTADISKKTVTLILLSCENPPRVIDQTMTLNESDVVPHPRYSYYNESNTIVVSHQNDGSIRVGNVLDTNLHGKVSVHFMDTGRDEWCWPTQFSVFSVKGFDLECIISLINDADEVKDCPSKKFLKVLEKLKSIYAIWDDVEGDNTEEREDSLSCLKYAISACQTAQTEYGKSVIYFTSIDLHNHLLEGSEIDCASKEIRTNVRTFCHDLAIEAEKLYHVLQEEDNGRISIVSLMSPPRESSESSPQIPTPTPMEVDEVQENPEYSGVVEENLDAEQETGIFIDRVVVDSEHPSTHQFASSTQFTPQHQRCFLSTVKRELENLRKSYAPGLKIRTFSDRYDLFSIAIAGPANTPYEDSLYLFDAVLPTNYPSVPPNFHFLAYGAGRLNPNLYAEGKVCVSLLGTWSGTNPQEKWTRESNLFQVVLSIQALILVNEPYHNEPGYEEEKLPVGSVRGRRHDYNLALMPKVAAMMLSQIERPGQPWEADIKKFYIEHVPRFVNRWKKWMETSDATKDETDFLNKLEEKEKPGFVIYPFPSALVSKMKSLIEKLEKSYKRLIDESLSSGEPKPEPFVPDEQVLPDQGAGEDAVSSSTSELA